jgi:hypothetical protein
MLKYIAEQIGADSGTLALYARREETRRAWKAQTRLTARYRKLSGRGKRTTVVCSRNSDRFG